MDRLENDMTNEKIRVRRRRRKRRRRASAIVFFGLCLVLVGILVVEWTGQDGQQVFRRTEQIPQSLLEFKELYPECAEFVDGYPQNKDKHYVIDLSDEVQKGTIPLFLQWDERWGYERYGDDFLATTACGPTSLAMVLCGLTGETTWNPLEVAKFADEQGYYIEGEGTSWELMTTGAQLLGLAASQGELNKEFIWNTLYEGNPIICSMHPGDFTYTGHFIVLTGVDERGDIILNDCNSIVRSERHWEMEELFPQIRNLWVYST